MMEKINVHWGLTVEEGMEKISLEELNCETMEEWQALPEEEKMGRLQEALDGISGLVSIVITSYE